MYGGSVVASTAGSNVHFARARRDRYFAFVFFAVWVFAELAHRPFGDDRNNRGRAVASSEPRLDFAARDYRASRRLVDPPLTREILVAVVGRGIDREPAFATLGDFFAVRVR